MAWSLIAGASHRRILNGTTLESEVEQAVVSRALEHQREIDDVRQQNLAVRIANELGPMLARMLRG